MRTNIHISTGLPALLFALAAIASTLPNPAAARPDETVFFEAPRDLIAVSTAQRNRAFTQLRRLGVKALRVELVWRDVAPYPTGTRKPSLDTADPNNYNWADYDPVLAEAQRLKWPVLLTVTAPAPKWATTAKQDYVTRPDDIEFREFMTAVGRHYGNEVSLFAIWNEPNHPQFLLPQFNSRGLPESPRLYRGLFQYGYAGLKAAGLAKPKVLMGETAPVGWDSLTRRYIREFGSEHPVAPLAFFRETLCLNSHYRKSGTCEELYPYGYSHHAYTVGSPYYKPPERDDVTIGVLSRLSSALDRAAAAHATPAHLPIYLTEFGIQSYPNHELGVPQPQQAEYDAIAEKIAWSNPRVVAFSQYLLRDDKLGGKPGSGAHGGDIGFQTGLEDYGGKRKPLYYGFPVPLVVSHHGRGYSLWGLVRPANGATSVTIEVESTSHRWRSLRTAHTHTDGSWGLTSDTSALAWRVRWQSPGGARYQGPAIGAS
jgi:hypothetical protein